MDSFDFQFHDGLFHLFNSAKITNEGEAPIWVNRAPSVLLDMPYDIAAYVPVVPIESAT